MLASYSIDPVDLMAQSQTDIAVIGAGPQALTLVTHVLQKKAKLRQRIQVFDPSGTWMARWHQQFAAQEIPHLRSPAVHHPDPNPHALRTFAEGRYHELNRTCRTAGRWWSKPAMAAR